MCRASGAWTGGKKPRGFSFCWGAETRRGGTCGKSQSAAQENRADVGATGIWRWTSEWVDGLGSGVPTVPSGLLREATVRVLSVCVPSACPATEAQCRPEARLREQERPPSPGLSLPIDKGPSCSLSYRDRPAHRTQGCGGALGWAREVTAQGQIGLINSYYESCSRLEETLSYRNKHESVMQLNVHCT